MSTAPANWYPDPQQPGTVRYWDGARWTEHVQPQIPPQQVPSPPAQPHADEQRQGQSVAHQPMPEKPKVKLFGARKQAEGLLERNAHLERVIAEMGALDVAEMNARRAELQGEIARLQAQAAETAAQVLDIERNLVDSREQVEFQEVGYYRFHHPAENSVKLADEIASVRERMKQIQRDKKAATRSTKFTYNNSASQGKKFVNDLHDMMLTAYNAEAENAVKSVKAGNLSAAKARLEKAADRIAKRGKMVDVAITPAYHRLRIRELELAADYWMMKQQEKEADRARREELREQRKAEQELAREREKLEKERQHYRAALAALEARGDSEGAERVRAQLAETEQAIETVDYRAANQRAGYVYVISNIGAFGERMVKIGMTRRLEPMDRVNELGDASVPFRFDVHAMFFSPDAVGVETALHQRFAAQRVNKINTRREFFYVTPHEVLDALREQVGAVTEFVEAPAAEEFRLSQGTPDTSF
ncbi:DUF4041 domain-containing protein [Ornithinimicrobium sufpigmenti]|uniref:DUF4041 domain-containing protein n=1 Tax=Ornithinimicrobium sufpigmenti TaxID=2508882 RepID=UPI001035B329|nr:MULTISPECIES: DUF4041 domain-containing protein [unclassified Ornithinimicrobium]